VRCRIRPGLHPPVISSSAHRRPRGPRAAVAPERFQPLVEIDVWRGIEAHGLVHREARDRAFAAFSERGGYPLVHIRPEAAWPELADQLNL